jgi:hypothetical protein
MPLHVGAIPVRGFLRAGPTLYFKPTRRRCAIGYLPDLEVGETRLTLAGKFLPLPRSDLAVDLRREFNEEI